MQSRFGIVRETPKNKSTAVSVYVIAHRNDDGWAPPCKIGIGSNPRSRVVNLQSGNPRPIRLYAEIALPERCHASDVERAVHHILRASRLSGEWFQVEPIVALQSAQLALSGILVWAGLDAGIALEETCDLTTQFSITPCGA